MSVVLPEAMLFAVYIYVAASTAYLLVFALAGKFGSRPAYGSSNVKRKIAVLIPAFKEDSIIVNTVRKAISHNYPPSCLQVVVIADSLQPATLQHLHKLPVQVLEVKFAISNKARSLHAALERLPAHSAEIAVILDADNIMEPNCLEKINDAFGRGCKAVQCHRTAKNSNNAIALLDAVGAEINAGIFRKGAAALRLSAAPAGSGMAVDFNLLKAIFGGAHILDAAAEDREIDVQLLKAQVRMEYIEDAVVYDEKVSDPYVFERQRTRWFEAQVAHCLRFFDKDMKNAPRTADYYNRFIQTLLLPRLLYLAVFGLILFLLLLQSIFAIQVLYPGATWWLGLMVTYGVVLLVAVPRVYYTGKTLQAVTKIPVLMAHMARAIMRMKRNRKEFIHTIKSYTDESGK